jgi:hypothetical protein
MTWEATRLLQPYRDRYRRASFAPLRIRLTLRPGSHLAGHDPLNLDNLLARIVVDEATGGLGLPDYEAVGPLPVPLAALWHDEGGLPLWAATPFRPVGVVAPDITTWHKRAQPGTLTGTKTGRFNPDTGRWQGRRIPLPTTLAESWEADAVGNPDEIARLLAPVPWVGKKRAQGFGEVLSWTVEAGDFALTRDGRLTRPLPAAAVGLLGGLLPEGEPALVGWTPPQWKPKFFRPGWWTGTPVYPHAADWFDAATGIARDT